MDATSTSVRTPSFRAAILRARMRRDRVRLLTDRNAAASRGDSARGSRADMVAPWFLGAHRCLGVKRPDPAGCPVVEGATISGSAIERAPRHFSVDAGFSGWPEPTHGWRAGQGQRGTWKDS